MKKQNFKNVLVILIWADSNPPPQGIRYRQIFSGGVSDQNENLVGRIWKIGRKIFRTPPARKKRGSQIFRLRRAFFVVEALKTAKKTVKNR